MSDLVNLRIAGEIGLTMPRPHAVELVARWASQLAISSENAVSHDHEMAYSDEHPVWDHSDGPEGQNGPEWDLCTDITNAEAFYQHVSGKAKVFLNLLIDNPGRHLDVDKLCELAAGTFGGSRSIAGALHGLYRAQRASGHRYPFYWWAGNPSRYAMKKSVAELFRIARANVEM